MSAQQFAVLLIMCTVWGFHFVVVKWGVGALSPLFYAAIRMSLVALVLSPFLRWHAGRMAKVLGAGICLGALNYAFLFTGLARAPAGASAIAVELYVPFATILSVMFLSERVGLLRIGGIFLAFSGVAVIAMGNGTNAHGGVNYQGQVVLGLCLIMLCAFSEAVGAVIVKKTGAINPFQLLAWFASIGAIVLWILTLILENEHAEQIRVAPRGVLIAAVLYSAIMASIVGHSSYYWLLQRLPLSLLAPSGLLTTLLAVLFATVILRDPLTSAIMLGGLMVLVGVGTVLVRTKTPSSRPRLRR